jgi:hypothetical protein
MDNLFWWRAKPVMVKTAETVANQAVKDYVFRDYPNAIRNFHRAAVLYFNEDNSSVKAARYFRKVIDMSRYPELKRLDFSTIVAECHDREVTILENLGLIQDAKYARSDVKLY